jgi:hypothetical protein|tara:strand:+ start:444 stop:653 length:210 start_codon:yes stop_codon:yes gene_type:complete
MAALKRKEQEQAIINQSGDLSFFGAKKNATLRISAIQELPEVGRVGEAQQKEQIKATSLPPIIFEECYV